MEQTTMPDIAQTLRDAGCDQPAIDQMLRLQAAGETEALTHLLLRHRAMLLCRIHDGQTRIDTVDYLLCSLKEGNHDP